METMLERLLICTTMKLEERLEAEKKSLQVGS